MNSKRLLLFLALFLLAVSCKKSSTSGSVNSAVAARDFTIPYLTDDKVQRFIQSMEEGQNPFAGMFARAVTAPGQIPSEAAAVVALNDFARKYGFQDSQDYTAVWGRIVAGRMALVAEEMKTGIRQMTEKSIQNAEAQLKNPSLSPQMRKVYEDQVAGGKKSLQEMDKPSSSKLNDSDLALVRKYQPQIDEANKRFNKRLSQGQ